MRNLKIIIAPFILLSSAIVILNSCKDQQIESNIQETYLNTRILKVETAMDDIVLPIGTKIETISDSQIDIELPLYLFC